MNDTHGQQGEGWIGFDLDGTLAKYDGWKGIDHIGEPVKPMVDLIKRMHDEGKVVKIMTARVAPKEKPEVKPNPYYGHVPGYIRAEASECKRLYGYEQWPAKMFIVDWCFRNLGFAPEIVYQKDHLMLELYDDRVKQVVPNEGWLVEDIAMSKRQRTKITIVKHDLVDIKWASRIQWFLLGIVAAVMVFMVLGAVLRPGRAEAEMKLKAALSEYIEAKDSGFLLPWGPDRQEDQE